MLEFCGAQGPGFVASRIPVHGSGGSGGRRRSSPTGARAYGMPRKISMPFVWLPRTRPQRVSTTVTASLFSRADPGASRDLNTRTVEDRGLSERRRAAGEAVLVRGRTRASGAGLESAQPGPEGPREEDLPERDESMHGRKHRLLGRMDAACPTIGRRHPPGQILLGVLRGGPAQARSCLRGHLQGPHPIEKGHPEGLRGPQRRSRRESGGTSHHDLEGHRAVKTPPREVQNREEPEADEHSQAARDVRGANPLASPLLDLKTASAAGSVEAQNAREQGTLAAARAALPNHTGPEKA
jgi:hypothetical protein